MMSAGTLIVSVGQEGVGRSTTHRALAPLIPWSARLDAADIVAVNPQGLDDMRLQLLWKNVAALAHNYWTAGFKNVVAGSFLNNVDHYNAFRQVLDFSADVYLIQLCAAKDERDLRRVQRSKPSTSDWRDHVDCAVPEDTTFAPQNGDYRYLRLGNDGIEVSESVARIRSWAPELFSDVQR